MLTKRDLKPETPAHEFDPATERQVRITLADDTVPGHRVWFARVNASHLAMIAESRPGGSTYVLELEIPGGVAEHYRQQGRRQLQTELRDLLNAERA